ncbi:MAG: diguanylate cyclase [Pirellulales bacterium]|nr:diguanylate cyclase [Pirellulales bacterium]
MSSQPLRVVVVSEDRKLLRQTSRFLNMFAYRVLQVAEMKHVRFALEGERPHVMIIDAAANEDTIRWLCEQVSQDESSEHVHTLLLLDNATPRAIVDSMSAGVDDFLQKPLVYGELLTRLRAAVRAVELERRIKQQEGIDPLTRLPNREAFSQLLRSHSQDNEKLVCVVADLDLLGHINCGYGLATGDELIQAFAEQLDATCDEDVVLGSFGGGRFAVLFTDSSLEAAKTWAERARQEMAQLEIIRDEKSPRATASFGVATGPLEQMIRYAEDALQTAKHSGRNCVVFHGQFDDEARIWSELAASGKIFERTAAQHVMSPLPVVLQVNETTSVAATLLENTQLDALVVVDHDGSLMGVVSTESNFADQNAKLREVMEPDVKTFNEDTSLSVLLEFFTQESSSIAVITDRGRPIGMVTREQLAILSEAAAIDRFAPGTPYSDTSDYLVVLDRALAGSTW